jgi:hypothetical protein
VVHLFVLALAGLFPVDAISQSMQPLLDRLPPYVKSIPKDHFVGISTPMPSLAAARRSAISDVKRQILNSMGSNYRHSYVDHSSGNVISGKIERTVSDKFRNDSQGFLIRIEDNIVSNEWMRGGSGKFICFVLIHCSEKLIHEMQRLARGAMVIGKILKFNANRVVLELTESNGVCVTFVKATVSITHLHKWAKAATLFFWHVEEETELAHEIPICTLNVCGGMKQVTIAFGDKAQQRPFLLNLSSSTLKAVLHGFDEIGRPVIVQIKSS